MAVTRYDMRPDRDPHFHSYMHRTTDGEYVKYEDYRELEELNVALMGLIGMEMSMQCAIDSVVDELKKRLRCKCTNKLAKP